jgi:hypothetical protein
MVIAKGSRILETAIFVGKIMQLTKKQIKIFL